MMGGAGGGAKLIPEVKMAKRGRYSIHYMYICIVQHVRSMSMCTIL